MAFLVREYAGDLSTWDIPTIAPLSQSMVARMWRGDRVGEDQLLVYAKALGKPVNPLRLARRLPPFPVDPVTGAPWLTLELLLPMLPSEVGERFATIARTRGVQNNPEQLIALVAEVFEKGTEKIEQEAEQAHPEAFLRALEPPSD